MKSSQWDFDTPVSHDMTLYAKTTEDTCEVGFIVPYSLDNLGYTHYDSRVDVKYGDEVLQEGVHYTLEWKKYFYPGTGKKVNRQREPRCRHQDHSNY